MPGILDAILAFSFLGGVAGSPADKAMTAPSRDGAPANPVSQLAAISPAPARTPVSEQWRRLTAIVERAADSGLIAFAAHTTAKPLLDEAELELQSIIADLSGVMTLPNQIDRLDVPANTPQAAASPPLAIAA